MVMSIPEAAQHLNLSVDSIRRRVRSGSLSASRDGRGQWWLDISDNSPPLVKPSQEERWVSGVGTPLPRSKRESLINALEDQIDDLRARLNVSENERREEAEKTRVERDNLLTMIERLSCGKGK